MITIGIGDPKLQIKMVLTGYRPPYRNKVLAYSTTLAKGVDIRYVVISLTSLSRAMALNILLPYSAFTIIQYIDKTSNAILMHYTYVVVFILDGNYLH